MNLRRPGAIEAFPTFSRSKGAVCDPDHALAMVDTESAYGASDKVKMRLPFFVGGLGSSEIAGTRWEPLAAGVAIAGVSIICGQDVCGIDPRLELDAQSRVKKAPDMEKRVEQYRRYHDGYGDMIVRLSVEDAHLGAAEYVIGQLGVECVELAWGQGTACSDEEIPVDSLERARELRERGYLVTPDPFNEANQAAFRDGVLKHFEVYSRPGFIDREGFMKKVEHIRRLGARRVTLRTGAYPMHGLTTTLSWASQARLDLLTIDGAAGMSSWWIQEWGAPICCLEATTCELCRTLVAGGAFVPDIAIAGGFSSADHVFKVLSTGSPFVKAVCMDHAWMIPGVIGKNPGACLRETRDSLSKIAGALGSTVDEVCTCYNDLVARYGTDAVNDMPLGAIAFYASAERLKLDLRHLMATRRNHAEKIINS